MTRHDTLLRREDTLLLFVDLQERLVPHIHNHEPLLANAVRLARCAGILGLPMLRCEQDKLGPTLAPLRETLGDSPVFPKLSFSCFGAEWFAEARAAARRKTLLLVGVEAHVCVLQTALQALAAPEGYAVHVVADAVGSRAPHNAELALARLRAAGAVITSTETAVFELLGRAGSDEFRAVLPLVK